MGCGMSRLGPLDEGPGCGGAFRGHLRRRLDEVRKLDGAAPEIGTSSTKVLLKDSGEGDFSYHALSVRKSVSEPSHADLVLINEPPPLQKINTREREREKEKEKEKERRIDFTDHNHNHNHNNKEESSMISPNNNNTNSNYNNHDDNINNNIKNNSTDHGGWGKAKEENYVPVHSHREDVDDDNNGRRISKNDEASWIGSPSFREYCVNNSDSEDSVKNDVVIPDKSQGQSTETIVVMQSGATLVCTDEACVWDGSRRNGHVEKKESRGGRFRKVLRHKPNFWQARSTPPKLAGKVV